MIEQKLLSEEEASKIYSPGELMRELKDQKDQYGLFDRLKHILGNAIGYWDPEFTRNFLQTSEILWAFRQHPDYLSYQTQSKAKVKDALGFMIPENPTDTENWSYILESCDTERSSLVGQTGTKDGDGNYLINPEIGLIYVPSLEGLTCEGLLTDILYAFGNKACTLPIQEEWVKKYGSNNPVVQERQFEAIDKCLSALYSGGLAFPHINEQIIGKRVFYPQDPHLLNEQNLLDFEYQLIKDKTNFVKRMIKEFAPERYDRLSRAISRA